MVRVLSRPAEPSHLFYLRDWESWGTTLWPFSSHIRLRCHLSSYLGVLLRAELGEEGWAHSSAFGSTPWCS